MAHASDKPHENVRVEFHADISKLPRGERMALPYLVEAVRLIDRAYLQQFRQNIHAVYAGKPFDTTKKPDFYPARLRKEAIEMFLDMFPDSREDILSPFTVVQRDPAKGLRAIPYSEHYEDFKAIASDLDTAARYVSHKPFADFLRLRAKAFRTNRYRESDVAWVQCVGAPLELIIGPFERYKDELFGIKRDVEGYLCVLLENETDDAKKFSEHVRAFDAYLGSLFGYRALTTGSPLTFVDQIIVGGGPVYGYTAMACSLPNEPDIHQEVGSKNTFFNNVMRAKFEHLSKPIAGRVLGTVPDWYLYDTYRAFVVGHEASHGISFKFGDEFGTFGSSIEEAKADVFGLLFLYYLEGARILERGSADAAVRIHAIDMLRQMRFGIKEAHAVGSLVQMKYLLESGAYSFRGDGLVYQSKQFKSTLEKLGKDLYDLSQTKDHGAGERFVKENANTPAELLALIERLRDLPVDIDPVYMV